MNDIDSSDWIRLLVKYKGSCKDCGKEIDVGQPAYWSRSLRSIKHENCHLNQNVPKQETESTPATPNLQTGICLKCGSKIGADNAKFCSSCGTGLKTMPTPSENEDGKRTVVEGLSQEELNQVKANPLLTASELGAKLEDMTVDLLKSMGYTTEVRKLFNIRGVPYEIDIVAKKGERLMAVECKNYAHPVGIAELREFHDKLVDLKTTDALFVTNSIFTDNAIAYADSKNIQHWDRREFYEKFGDMMAGRYGSHQELSLYLALPVSVEYEEVTRLHLANASKVKISRSRLVLYPYYKFDYRLDIQRTDPVRNSRRVTDEGALVIDCLTGEILSWDARARSKVFVGSKDSDEKVENLEQKTIISELTSVRPVSRYKVRPGPGYDIGMIRADLPFKSARTIAIERVVKYNTLEFDYHKRISRNETVRRSFTVIPKPYEVWIKKASMIYVPKWIIEYEANGRSYVRKLMAASGTVILDKIAFCPKHFFLGKFNLKKKKTFAVCEQCGVALCEDHIRKTGESYYCEEHDPTRPTREGLGKVASVKKGLSGIGKLVRANEKKEK